MCNKSTRLLVIRNEKNRFRVQGERFVIRMHRTLYLEHMVLSTALS